MTAFQSTKKDLGMSYGAIPACHSSLVAVLLHVRPYSTQSRMFAVSCSQVRDQARRFITLVDELYNARVRLICSADSPPDLLFAGNLNEEPIIDLEQLQYEGAVEGLLSCPFLLLNLLYHAVCVCMPHERMYDSLLRASALRLSV